MCNQPQIFYLDITWYGSDCSFPLNFICWQIWNSIDRQKKSHQTYIQHVYVQYFDAGENTYAQDDVRCLSDLVISKREIYIYIYRRFVFHILISTNHIEFSCEFGRLVLWFLNKLVQKLGSFHLNILRSCHCMKWTANHQYIYH